MARFSFASQRDSAMPMTAPDTGNVFDGWYPEAGTIVALVVVEAFLFGALRRYFRHSHGG